MKNRRNRLLVTIIGAALLLMALGCAATQETTGAAAPAPAKEAAAAASAAPAAETPEWFFHDIVDAEFVKQHIGAPMPEGVMLIDARPYKPKYISGHIPLAVSIPDSKFDKMTDLLPADKNALVIFYCEGPT